jgi:hypothetical protein
LLLLKIIKNYKKLLLKYNLICAISDGSNRMDNIVIK